MNRRNFLTLLGLGFLVSVSPVLISACITKAQHQESSDFSATDDSKSILFYVAPNGNDSWSGKLSQPNKTKTDGPFATLARSRDAIRELKRQQGGVLKQPVTVLLRGGTYFLTEPLIFTPEDSGTAEFPITYAAYQEEKPVISGGRLISNWKKEVVNGKWLWVAEIPEVAKGEWYFRNLWVDGERRYRARYPNRVYLRVDGNPPGWDESNWWQPISQFNINPSDLRAWKSLVDAEAVVGTKWEAQHLPIKKIDYTKGLIFSSKSSRIRIDNQAPFYLENSLDFLDSPGEWYLERSSGRIYYYSKPGKNPNKVKVIAPILSQLVLLKGRSLQGDGENINYDFVEHIKFQGLNFSHTNWELPPDFSAYEQAEIQREGKPCSGIILGEGIRNCLWENCTIAHVGSWGLDLGIGCQQNKIIDCEFSDLGAGGIRIGLAAHDYKYDDDRLTYGNEIIGCHIYEVGRIFHHAVGIWIGQSHNNLISRNHIHDLFYSGISVGWTWGYYGKAKNNIIEFNHIHHIGSRSSGEPELLSDLGGIYTLGQQPGTVIKGNIIHDIQAFNYGGWGVYLDEGSSQILVENNLVYQTRDGGFHQHYGKQNIIRNNIFAFSRLAQVRRTRLEQHLSFTFERNIVYWKQGKLLDGRWGDFNFAFERNIYWHTGEEDISFANLSWDEWRAKGMDKNSLIADPLFIAPEKGDFRLKPNSPALKLRFKPLTVATSNKKPSDQQ